METVVKYKMNSGYISQYLSTKRTGTLNDETFEMLKSREKKSSNLNVGFKKNKEVSKASKKKIVESIKWLNLIAKNKTHTTKNGKKIGYKLQLITLTLPFKQMHTDTFITSKMLGNFLNEMRNMYDLKNYVWRAEKQKNGNIHYHIVTDSPINWHITQKVWNRILEPHGYIIKWREKMIAEANQKGEDFQSKYPNSTDIKRVPTQWKVENYISKYLAKNHKRGRRPNGKKKYGIKKMAVLAVTCRHYSMSQNLSRLKDFKKENTDLAEFAFHAVDRLPNVIKSFNDFCTYKIIEISRICGVFKDFKNELLKRLANQIELIPTEIMAFSINLT